MHLAIQASRSIAKRSVENRAVGLAKQEFSHLGRWWLIEVCQNQSD
jgi:hypothetical protein